MIHHSIKQHNLIRHTIAVIILHLECSLYSRQLRTLLSQYLYHGFLEYIVDECLIILRHVSRLYSQLIAQELKLLDTVGVAGLSFVTR